MSTRTSKIFDDLGPLIRGGLPHGWQVRMIWTVYETGDQQECEFSGYEIQQGFDLFTIDPYGNGDLLPGWTAGPVGIFDRRLLVTSPDGAKSIITDLTKD